MSKMVFRTVLVGIIAILVLTSISGCGGSRSPKSVVKGYMDDVMQGRIPWSNGTTWAGSTAVIDRTNELMGYEVRGYEIKSVSGNVVSVEITFGSQAGTDLKETWVFRVEHHSKGWYNPYANITVEQSGDFIVNIS